MIKSLQPISIAPKAKSWLANTRQARVLHVFQSALNLINDDQQVFSLVWPTIGNGPFSMVIKVTDFRGIADSKTPIKIRGQNLWIGDVSCPCSPIPTWEPRPDWDALRIRINTIAAQVPSIETFVREHGPDESLSQIFGEAASKPHILQDKIAETARGAIQNLSKGLSRGDLSLTQDAVKSLAGLGLGLTPAGDDYLMGVIYGLWIAYPKTFAVQCAELIYQTAKGKTNYLSAAWLSAAMGGETGEIWHDLFAALTAQKNTLIQKSISRILATGHSSGSDALGGLILALKNAR